MAELTPLQIENLTDGQLINQHGFLLYIVIEEDWTNEDNIRRLELLGDEIRSRNDAV